MAQATTAHANGFEDTLKELEVPAEFAEYETTENADVIVRLEEWRRKAYVVLDELRTQLAAKQDTLTLEERADVISTAAQFDGEGFWVLDTTTELAREILNTYNISDIILVERVLSHHIKPIFQKNPHPDVNPETGRKSTRSAAQLDYYEGQEWKRYPGILNVLSWCVRHIEGTNYERLWHLVIPPAMTLLDDYEARYKIPGVRVISEMLDRVPPELLRRTGIDGLILASLQGCFTSLRKPETPTLLRLTIPTCVKLVEATTAPKSAQRFEQLCAVLGDGIIGSVWFYSTSEPESLAATLDMLPTVVRALGLGVARYLKAMIPQLTYPLVTAPDNTTSTSVQLASAKALRVVIAVCAPRMQRWKGDILNGVCRCWVTLVESGASDNLPAQKEKLELRNILREVCQDLAHACPSVVQDEFTRLSTAKPSLFSALVGPLGKESEDG
ncbi:hypothetical protein NM688_g4421 [Phlebia brevispora]|uniref:Uncharacterized protein n=1 Tax=Phlebia brevispora TaxID=194682 RepID=A0ACC1T311_9APHY|nr:hypothetical protein NM688_g4421 [Phlebia brevispora]